MYEEGHQAQELPQEHHSTLDRWVLEGDFLAVGISACHCDILHSISLRHEEPISRAGLIRQKRFIRSPEAGLTKAASHLI